MAAEQQRNGPAPTKSGICWRRRTRALARPEPSERPLLAGARFLLEPDLDGLSIAAPGSAGRASSTKFYIAPRPPDPSAGDTAAPTASRSRAGGGRSSLSAPPPDPQASLHHGTEVDAPRADHPVRLRVRSRLDERLQLAHLLCAEHRRPPPPQGADAQSSLPLLVGVMELIARRLPIRPAALARDAFAFFARPASRRSSVRASSTVMPIRHRSEEERSRTRTQRESSESQHLKPLVEDYHAEDDEERLSLLQHVEHGICSRLEPVESGSPSAERHTAATMSNPC